MSVVSKGRALLKRLGNSVTTAANSFWHSLSDSYFLPVMFAILILALIRLVFLLAAQEQQTAEKLLSRTSLVEEARGRVDETLSRAHNLNIKHVNEWKQGRLRLARQELMTLFYTELRSETNLDIIAFADSAGN